MLDTYHPDTLYFVSKDVRIRGYSSKPKGVREQKSLGYTGLGDRRIAVLLPLAPKPAVKPTQPLTQWVPVTHVPG